MRRFKVIKVIPIQINDEPIQAGKKISVIDQNSNDIRFAVEKEDDLDIREEEGDYQEHHSEKKISFIRKVKNISLRTKSNLKC